MCQALGDAKLSKMRFLLFLAEETGTQGGENAVRTVARGCGSTGGR